MAMERAWVNAEKGAELNHNSYIQSMENEM